MLSVEADAEAPGSGLRARLVSDEPRILALFLCLWGGSARVVQALALQTQQASSCPQIPRIPGRLPLVHRQKTQKAEGATHHRLFRSAALIAPAERLSLNGC